MSLIEFRDLLLTALSAVYHYTAQDPPETYLVWAEYSANGVYADGQRVAKTQSIQLDLYTKTEFDPVLDALECVLTEAGVAFDGPDTEYEPDTGYIHHRLDCEVLIHGTD